MRASDLERVKLPPETLPETLSHLTHRTFSSGSSVPVVVYGQSLEMAERACIDRYLTSLPLTVDVLDIAAAEGSFSNALFESRQFEGFTATWVDRNSSAMDAGTKVVPFGSRVKRVPADLEDVRWARMIRDAAFDCTLIGALHHHVASPKYSQIIDIVIQRKLRPKGRLVAVELGGGLYEKDPLQRVVEAVPLSGADGPADGPASLRFGHRPDHDAPIPVITMPIFLITIDRSR